MSDHCVIGLRAAIKALKHTIAPAVDPANPLANEQLRMVCAFLSMLAEQLPHRSMRIRYDLQSATALAEAVLPHVQGSSIESVAALEAARALARRALAADYVTETEIEHATGCVNAALSATVRALNECDVTTRERVERAVVLHAKTWLDVQRAWFLPLGFDPNARTVPSIVTALSAPASNA